MCSIRTLLARKDVHFKLQGKKWKNQWKKVSFYGTDSVLAPFAFMTSLNIHYNVMWELISIPLWQLRK